eukprot:TRINITY_DN28668_c0_g1_i1.p3 TRINITY_DN28668_c0_g1~~TRINITY_DN28668_c0_g1_i1.p3  ORF type:complete len:213 (+),score=-19.74 TRINITY_DN28668_c0_g1_i1:448-1086(+)
MYYCLLFYYKCAQIQQNNLEKYQVIFKICAKFQQNEVIFNDLEITIQLIIVTNLCIVIFIFFTRYTQDIRKWRIHFFDKYELFLFYFIFYCFIYIGLLQMVENAFFYKYDLNLSFIVSLITTLNYYNILIVICSIFFLFMLSQIFYVKKVQIEPRIHFAEMQFQSSHSLLEFDEIIFLFFCFDSVCQKLQLINNLFLLNTFNCLQGYSFLQY